MDLIQTWYRFQCTLHFDTGLINVGLIGLVVKASASRAEDHGFESCLRQEFFGVIIPVTSKLALQ